MGKYTSVDFLRNSVFGSCKTQFLMLLDEGMSLQQLHAVAMDVQGAVGRALQMAASDAIVDLGQPQGMPPMPQQPPPQQPQPPQQPEPPEENPFL